VISLPQLTNKQAVIDALSRLPENASLEEITEELRIMAAIRRGRADIAAGRTKTQQEVHQPVESWATASTSQIIWSDAAVGDLADICFYIAQDDPEAASLFARGILDHVDILATFPSMDLHIRGVREGRFVLLSFVTTASFYDVNEDRESVEILHV
jgi:plasmid stabilization system protein ParE/predicted transcriptional regulator